jgi:hypothetical protein
LRFREKELFPKIIGPQSVIINEQTILESFRQFFGTLFSEPLQFKGMGSVDVFSVTDELSILRMADECVLFVRDGIGSFNVRVS